MIRLDKTKTYLFGMPPAEWKWCKITNTWRCDDPKFGRWGWEDRYFFSALCLGLVTEKDSTLPASSTSAISNRPVEPTQ